MTTTQSEERVNHPRWYTSHPSGIECIDLIEHLPCNLANATKYVWRCGLKTTETPLRDLKSAQWYVEREERRIRVYELDDDDDDSRPRKTDIVWRSLAHRVIESETVESGGTLGEFLISFLNYDFDGMLDAIDHAIKEIEERVETFGHTGPIADEPTMG